MNIRVILILFLYILQCECFNILVVFTTPMKSHDVLGEAIVELLWNAGHEVTYVTAFPKKVVPPRIHQVDVSRKDLDSSFDFKKYLDSTPDRLLGLRLIMNYTHEVNVKAMESDNVQKLLNDSSKKFDAVIIDAMYSDILVGFAGLYDCPLIWLSSLHPNWHMLRLVDELRSPAEVHDCCMDTSSSLNFWERLEQLFFQVVAIYFRDYKFHHIENAEFIRLFGPVFARKGKELPSFNELRYNASLVLSNSHPTLAYPIKLPPNFVSVGGYHIGNKKGSLSKDLKKLMDDAKNGVILFSLGSNLKSKDIPEDLKQDIINVFGELKQTVLWKIEETIPDLPHNVRALRWAPQQDILAHPNCVLFITHGGLLSVTEAYHYGVPIIGIPVFADQFKNINLIIRRGFAKRVNLTYNLAQDLKLAINEIVHDKRYIEKAKEWSAIYHHRPANPRAELVHWVEHVILTRGASYLRSPALEEPFYKKLYLDLVGLIMLILTTMVFLIKIMIIIFTRKDKTVKVE